MMSNTPYKTSHPYYEGPESTGQKRAWSQDTPYSREENRDLVRRQVGKLVIIPMDMPESAQYVTDMVERYHIGGVLLCRRSIRHAVDISRIVRDLQVAARKAGHSHPLFIMIEQENGMFSPFGNGDLGTQFPGALAVGAFRSSEILYDIARASAQELQSLSVNTNVAPVLNIEEQNPEGLSSRMFGDDPANVWRCTSAILDAHRSTNLVSIVKHFPAPRQGSGGILDTRNIATEPRYAPFRKAFENGVDGVLLEPTMWAASTDTTFGGKDSLPKNLIRKHLQYEGVLIGSVDKMSDDAAGRCASRGQLSIRGFVNGCDMLILCEHPHDVTDALEEIYTAVETGNITRASLEQSWERIRRVKERYLRWEEAIDPPPIHLTLQALMRRNRELSFRSYEMATTVIKDARNLLPLTKPQRQSALRQSGTCVLLTPVAPPRFPGQVGVDPFEYLGRAINARSIAVSHAPYTHEGLQETHTSLLKKANIIIFVLSLDTDPEYRSQIETMRSLARQRLVLEPPIIVITACSPREMLPEVPFLETVVSCYEYSREALESAVSIIFGEVKATGVLPLRKSLPLNSGAPVDSFQRWEVHEWEKRRDLYASADLWKKCFGWNPSWNLNSGILSDLLDRPGNAKHYVVKDPRSHGKILGLCATYTIHAGKSLVGSMALLMVDPDFRNSGIGTALHDEAFQFMRAHPEIDSVQLGSIFPRFFPGLPELLPKEQKEWFKRRGWKIEDNFIFDLYQNITNWRPSQQDVFADLSRQGITFGVCNAGVFDSLIQFEDKHFSSYPGWVEKYRALKDTNDYADAVLAFGIVPDGQSAIVGAALVFSGAGSNKISKEVPWPKAIGERVGGLACVGMGPEFRGRGVGIGLVCAAIIELQSRGLTGCFVDWSTDRQVYEELGFETHGKYHNMAWRKV
ncbi:hypothetical protein TWF679_008820 [Orbilia oligospora]|uniref:N-acetyltransferase domain-containing protein n=1 Tax=Orbilia oligospora TaxID=2813651 RepID=A0A8H8V425_ORBOL|nr:hypothetical protein TWF679_008820 [Orbilia oligospora]